MALPGGGRRTWAGVMQLTAIRFRTVASKDPHFDGALTRLETEHPQLKAMD
jgi:hypothetical protein